jgi:predicted Kef-type K+ transport protein
MLRFLTSGESHGPQLTVIVEGLPAGLVLNASPLGHNAAERSLPLRDAFAVLFFLSDESVYITAQTLAVDAGLSGL